MAKYDGQRAREFLFEVRNNISGDDSANKGTQTVVSY